MSSEVANSLRNSRLAQAISQMERGEPVDWSRLAALQPLDVAHEMELELARTIEREDDFNGRFEQFLGEL